MKRSRQAKSERQKEWEAENRYCMLCGWSTLDASSVLLETHHIIRRSHSTAGADCEANWLRLCVYPLLDCHTLVQTSPIVLQYALKKCAQDGSYDRVTLNRLRRPNSGSAAETTVTEAEVAGWVAFFGRGYLRTQYQLAIERQSCGSA